MPKQRINLNNFKQKNWFKIVRRENSAFLNSLLRMGSAIRNKELEFDNSLKHHLVIFNDAYAVEEEFAMLKKRMIAFAEKDKNFIEKYFLKLESDCKKYLEILDGINRKHRKDLSDKNIVRLFKLYIDASLKVVSHLWPPLAVEDYIVGQIEDRLSGFIDPKKNYDEYNGIFQLLLTSQQPSLFQKRRDSILNLAVLLKRGKISEDSNTIKNEFIKYCWIDDHFINFSYETREHFLEEIKISAKNYPEKLLNKFKNEAKEIKKKKERVARKYKLDKGIMRWARLASKLPHLRFLRTDVLNAGAYMMHRDFLREVSLKVGSKDLKNCFYWEIYEALKNGKLDKKRISKRKREYTLAVSGKLAEELNRNFAMRLKKIIESRECTSKDIKGNVACRGFAKGVVKVILSSKEFGRFGAGDILVTSMTTPDYVILMKKSAAIVTDEGGISCHAAIVSRELKIPCIIGTKVATKVLRDGDLVEVDADKGVVKILKRK